MDSEEANHSVFQAIDVRKLVYRRQRYDTNCRYIAKYRDSTFKQFSMEQLIPVAFYTISSDLERMPSLELLVTVACQMYKVDKADLYSDCYKYYKVLSPEYRPLAILECAAINTAHYIIDTSKREAWASQCCNQLKLLKDLICQSDGKSSDEESQHAHQRKRRRKVQHHDTNDLIIHTARMALIQEVKGVVGAYLFVGLKTSRMRKQEGLVTLTDTVRLRLASQEGEDFKLVIRVESSVGNAISQSNSASVEDLEDVLGNYIFEGMMASKKRQAEAAVADTNAVVIIHGGRDEDSIVEITLCFSTGKEIFATIYP
ncbi:hypothetical protein F5Y16DRAFT_406766 [Xylariaceae sp. FL0255]|nr:hypothetical protein F5Y16DRAFT_406766 [Xylariaceae sp. FL0255]